LISYFQAIVIGLLQGVTELFPVSSLGHSVLLPGWLGWHSLVDAQSAKESFYLAFLVALHVATAIALVIYFRADWVRLLKAFGRIVRTRAVNGPDERMVVLLVVGTIPVGIIGLAFEHSLRTVFAKPVAAAIFLRPMRPSPDDASTPSPTQRAASSGSPRWPPCSPASRALVSP
jgi:undecaprenyl-diphosphatase